MQTKGEEIEVKFFLSDPKKLITNLTKEGATLIKDRIFERDLRFDDVGGSLRSTDRVLRLRMDTQASLTYKDVGVIKSGTTARPEFEVVVSDFRTTQKILGALGYHSYMAYEKYRTTYDFLHCEVVLDEMPFGWFCEVEGESPQAIKKVAIRLGLQWGAHIVIGYLMIFQQYKEKFGLGINDLTFTNFKNIIPTAQDLGVIPADN